MDEETQMTQMSPGNSLGKPVFQTFLLNAEWNILSEMSCLLTVPYKWAGQSRMACQARRERQTTRHHAFPQLNALLTPWTQTQSLSHDALSLSIGALDGSTQHTLRLRPNTVFIWRFYWPRVIISVRVGFTRLWLSHFRSAGQAGKVRLDKASRLQSLVKFCHKVLVFRTEHSSAIVH